jgi:WD40 repeat protein
MLQVQVTGGCLSTVHFLETNQKVFMLLCGDGGIWGYDWKHWLQLIDETGTKTGTTALEPKLEMHYGPHPCPYRGAVKINDFTVAHGEKYIFGAAADAFEGYKWDMETQKLLCNYPSARKGELSSITCIDSDKSSTVLMGGQDGIIGMWDCHADTLIDNIDLKTTMIKHPSLVVERGQAPPWNVNTERRPQG